MRELHPVLVLIVRSRARQQDLEADLREEGRPNRQQVLEPVHQQPHGVDGEDLLPAALGACSSSTNTARTALRPRRPQMARIGLS